jgi:hypothetical protein
MLGFGRSTAYRLTKGMKDVLDYHPVVFGLVSFSIFSLFRFLLEYFAGPFPIGFDSVSSYEMWLRTGSQVSIHGGPLFQLLLHATYKIIGNPVTTVKLLMILLQGSLAACLYFWLRRIVNNPNLAFLATVTTNFYFPILRISWDLGRNMLALSLGLAALVLLNKEYPTTRLLCAISFILLAASALADPITIPLFAAATLFEGRISILRRAFLLSILSSLFVIEEAGGSSLIILSQSISENLNPNSNFYLGTGSVLFFIYLIVPVTPFIVYLVKQHRLVLDRRLSIWIMTCLLPSPVLVLGYRFLLLSFLAIIPIITTGLWHCRAPIRIKATFVFLIFFLGISYAVFQPSAPFPYYSIYRPYLNLMPTSLMSNTLPMPEAHAALNILVSNQQLWSQGFFLITSIQFYDYALRAGVPPNHVINVGNFLLNSTTFSSLAQLHDKQLSIISFTSQMSTHNEPNQSFDLIVSEDGIGLYLIQ